MLIPRNFIGKCFFPGTILCHEIIKSFLTCFQKETLPCLDKNCIELTGDEWFSKVMQAVTPIGKIMQY